jgi:hypothetical protein
MAILLLNPLALGVLLGLVGYAWLVWRGSVRRWFGRPERWTVLAWPAPVLVVLGPLIAAVLLRLLRLAGVELGDGDGGLTDAGLYAALVAVPGVALAVWPPRWLLPAWARARLATFPAERGAGVPGSALPAVQATRGHGSRARWVWQVDGVAGFVWIDGTHLRFRAAAGPDGTTGVGELADEEIAAFRLRSDGDLRVEPPRGGAWRPGHLDVELTEVDRIARSFAPPWRRAGLLTLEVAGRRPLTLWVADARRLVAELDTLRRGG